jgi:predicted secreted protein
MAKRLSLCLAVLVVAAMAAGAGDIAQYVNLGFSPDSRYFMFGQYGVLQNSSTPWAEAYIVDVAGNVYAPHGSKKFTTTRALEPGASPLGALLNTLADLQPQVRQYRVDHLLSGRLLYILVDGQAAPDTLEFRDFQSGGSYKVAITQSATTNGNVISSFGLAITVTRKDGTVHTVTAGSPTLERRGVKAYHIKQIVLAPNDASLVFLIQREEQDTDGDNIRYMVETVGLK